MQFRQLLLASGDSPRKKNQFFFFSSYYFLYARGKKWEQAFRGDVVLPHHCVFVQHQFSFSLSLFSLMFLTCGRTDTAMEKAVPFFFPRYILLFTLLCSQPCFDFDAGCCWYSCLWDEQVTFSLIYAAFLAKSAVRFEIFFFFYSMFIWGYSQHIPVQS